MGKVIVQYLPEVEDYLDDLIRILFQKEYFGFSESAEIYVDTLVDFIDYNIGDIDSKSSPKELKYLGSNYIKFQANKNTTWYIFFEKSDNKFLVRFITNNHSELAKYFK